jgi:hypothetical protein
MRMVVCLLELTNHKNISHAGVSEQPFPAEKFTDVKEIVFGDSLYVFSLPCATNKWLANPFL